MSVWLRWGNVGGVVVPVIGFVVAIVLLWGDMVGLRDLTIMVVLYVLTGMGITVGFHRLLTHRSFEATRGVRAVLAVLGSMALEGPVINWVADHRKHHAFTDEEGDPHSPHLSRLPGLLGGLAGLWHAHVGWLFDAEGRADRERYAPDLLRDRTMQAIDRLFFLWVAIGLAVPFALGWLLGGTLGAALTALLWGGLVRIFLLHHATFAINSLCHFMGRRRFRTDDESRNVMWLAPLTFGEAWHHNHHAFPTSAFHGLRRWEIDPGAWLIRGLERLGLAWSVRRIPPERQAEKLAG
jgi:stearoyl-CoA desaturase (delta-9 desaturase)